MRVRVENVGGIDTAEVELSEGGNVFFGENASNRSSLLSAIAGALGARPPTLKTDSDEGSVVIELGGEEYRIDMQRRGGTVVTDRTPYATDEQLCDTFVRLLEDNPIRQHVGQLAEGDLYDLLMGPVDTAQIEAEIEQAKADREEIRETLDHYEELEQERTTLRKQESDLTAELDSVTETLESVRADLDDLDERQVSEDDREVLSELDAKRSEHRAVLDKIETHERALARSESELETVTAELADLTGESETDSEVVTAAVEDIEAELDSLRTRKRELDDTINALQTVVEVNRRTPTELLTGEPGSSGPGGDSDGDTRDSDGDTNDSGGDTSEGESSDEANSEGHLTDALDPRSQPVECWTCGSSVERSDIDAQTEELQSIIDDERAEREEIETEIQRLKERRDEWEQRREERQRLRERRENLRSQIDEHEETIATLSAERSDLEAEIEALETEAEEIQQHDDSEFMELHQRANDLAYERGQLERQLDDVRVRIDEIENTVADREELVAERESLADRLDSLHDRIYEIERETVDTINETMDAVLAQLAFENIERIWVERRVSAKTDAGRADGFALHIVRTGADGAAYEDTIETLSTSEREVVGIVLAVAGYLVHDVNETVPVLLLDAIESLDADRIQSLLAYLSDHTQYLVATAHPEDRDAFSEEFTCRHIDAALD